MLTTTAALAYAAGATALSAFNFVYYRAHGRACFQRLGAPWGEPPFDALRTAASPAAAFAAAEQHYMLTAERPHQDWVNNMSDHVHYHHAGGTLIYNLVLPDGTFVERRLGTNVAAGDEPQLVVKGGTLKSVRLEAGAEFGLLGEGVAPGFDFRDFKWVTAKELKALSPEAFAKTSDLIKPQPEETFDHFYDK